MKALLICPGAHPPLAALAARAPLAVTPLLGRSVLEYWIEALVARGARHIIVLASDRPAAIRHVTGDGRRWGARIEVVPLPHAPTVEQARSKYQRDPSEWLSRDAITVLDHLPQQPESPLFDGPESWFKAQKTWLAHAATPGRIGLRQPEPGVFVGLRSEIAPTARLVPPCWIGDHARIGAAAVIGPGAIIDDRVVVDTGARVVDGLVGPDTYVGKFVSVERSIAYGALLVNWRSNSSVQVPDPFLLSDLGAASRQAQRTSWFGRAAAAAVLVLTAPIAFLAILVSLARGESPWQLRLALRSQRGKRQFSHETFAYYELTGARNWLRRWPQFWSVVRGDLAWVGNRPLRPTQALGLTNEFERLWLAADVGLVSLADARGCPDGISDEAIGHASFYAVNAGRKLEWFVLSRALLRAAMAWPIWGQRRKDTAVPLQELVPKQEL